MAVEQIHAQSNQQTSRLASQRAAMVLTVICIILAAIYVLMQKGTTGTGGGGLVLIFPLLLVVGVHLALAPAAIIAALVSGRFVANLWIYAYFVFGMPSLGGYMMGMTPVEVFERIFN